MRSTIGEYKIIEMKNKTHEKKMNIERYIDKIDLVVGLDVLYIC